MDRTVAPYGTWTSPITAEMLVGSAVGFAQVEVGNGRTTWLESRPDEGGRQVVVELLGDGTTRELTPTDWSVRTSVHEYGGRSYTLTEDALIASRWDDQRLWLIADGAEPVALTPAPAEARADRYADPVVTPDGRWVVCVRERHGRGGEGAEVVNDLVAVAVPPDAAATTDAREPIVLASGHDFYAAPRLSPDGTELAWISWDQPAMPWDETECWRAPIDTLGATPTLGVAKLVAGGASVLQPAWSPTGSLHHVSDASGWWNIHEGATNRFPLDAEESEPGWVFGSPTYGFCDDGTLVASWSGPAGSGIGPVSEGRAAPLDVAYSSYHDVQVAGRSIVCVAGSPTVPWAVVRIDVDHGAVDVLRSGQEVTVGQQWLSVPEHVSFPTAGGEEAWAWFYPPASGDHEGPSGEAPPLVVMTHGGPTGAASPVFKLAVQWWTSRGFAVADVDYRGSAGYGRAYRHRLDGQWGVCDMEDCAAVVDWLGRTGRVDPARAAIRGGSAGGYTTLCALAFTDTFKVGASLYGVADLELLAADTHKFEARYLDSMVGPWPADAETYRARSPIHHLDGFTCPVILFQGLDDFVVPPAQSALIADALRARGVPVAHLTFEGEGHGFRRSATIVAVAEAELSFYGRVLGFVPAGAVDVAIDNADALPG